MAEPLRAAVIGASGIGKHHAKWLHAAGCQVVAFAGSSRESVDATRQALRDVIPFAGRGYVGTEALLDGEELDVVCVCSPPRLHHTHLLEALAAGCHVLCEKPLFWDPGLGYAEVLEQAAELAAAARHHDVVTAINTQYAAGAAPYLELCERAGAPVSPEASREFYMRMDSRGGKGPASGRGVWIDLASHPLSVLLALVGPGEMVADSACCTLGASGTVAGFRFRTAGNREVTVQIEVHNAPSGPLARRFGLDGRVAEYEGRNDEEGVYCAYLSLEGAELKAPDFMRQSITAFVDAVRGQGRPLADLRSGLLNLQMQLGLLRLGSEGG